ncbi:MAG: amidohydrolase family protein [Actinomycetota bacterium]|jgi:dihydropyrimidinase|nr:amidohydrolase family protein [Actinomycetota bacterium]MDA8279364.1 amidohydrolase family protein [Actinomycetota bacterium]
MRSIEPVDLAVANGRVVLPGEGVVDADLWIRDGRVAGIVSPGTPVQATKTLDASGKTVLPGAIDAHIHMGTDITMAKAPEEVVGETASAVAGGVTTVLAYLMSAQPYEELFPDAVRVMEEHSTCDFGFHFCIGTQHQLDQLGAYVSDLGVSSFKFFMNFKGEEGAYLNLPGNDDGFLWELLKRSSGIGAMVNPHAENVELVWHLREAARAAGGPDLVAWNNARPPIVEAEAEARMAMFAEVLDASVYAVHCSSKLALDALTARRASHDGVFIETCPHYLLLDQDATIGTYGKVNPPLRTAEDREALWQALAAGAIDVVGSDHVPRHKSAKEKDIWSASAGFPGIETLLPLLLSEGHVKRGIPLERIVDVVSARPAQLFGLAPRKGAISVGADADLAIVDFAGTTVFAGERMHSAAAYTPYEGREAAVSVTHTIVGGRVVASNGQVTATGGGRYLRRAASGRAALSALARGAVASTGGA